MPVTTLLLKLEKNAITQELTKIEKIRSEYNCIYFKRKQTFVLADIQLDVSLSSLHFFIHFLSH